MVDTFTDDGVKIVVIPINEAGLIRMRDLRDFVEATDHVAELDYVRVLHDEIRYEVGE